MKTTTVDACWIHVYNNVYLRPSRAVPSLSPHWSSWGCLLAASAADSKSRHVTAPVREGGREGGRGGGGRGGREGGRGGDDRDREGRRVVDNRVECVCVYVCVYVWRDGKRR